MPTNLTGKSIYKQSDGSGALVPAGTPLTGGTAAFAYSAPEGFGNGKPITITTNSATFVSPTKQISMGFGKGWLYSQTDGTPLATHTVGSEEWNYEFNSGGQERFVQTVGSQKVLRSFLRDSATNLPNNAGFINWDTGAEITHSDTAYAFKRSRCVTATNPSDPYQWKQIRMRALKNLENIGAQGYNELYNPAGDNGWNRIDVTFGVNGTDKGFTTFTPYQNGLWSSFGMVWNPNTPDVADGDVYTHYIEEGGTGFVRNRPENSDTTHPVDVISANQPDRPRVISTQDYIGNNDLARDITIELTDLYFKINGDLFLLADNVDLSLCTQRPVPLVPVTINSNQSWTFDQWLGDMDTFAGKYIHRLDAMLNPLQVVAL